MGYIADLSRYDPLEAVDSYPDGVILNVEDPGFAAKRDRAIERSVPWGTYSWVYPGGGAAAAQRAHDAGYGALGAWLDYEQSGVVPADLTEALARGDELGMKLGVYTYLDILPTVADRLGNHPLWIAYYPGGTDWQERYSDAARIAGALIHQFTSSGGTRDLSVVLDADRWAAWTGATPTPTPNPDLEDDMAALDYFATDPTDRRHIWWFSAAGRRHIGPDEWAIEQFSAAAKGLPPIKPFAGTPEMFATVHEIV